jgi:hypothetical protein
MEMMTYATKNPGYVSQRNISYSERSVLVHMTEGLHSEEFGTRWMM